jgi:hypothetical protein
VVTYDGTRLRVGQNLIRECGDSGVSGRASNQVGTAALGRPGGPGVSGRSVPCGQ